MYLDALTLLGAQHHTVVPVDGNGVYYVLQYERGHGSFWARRQNKSMMIAIIAVVAWERVVSNEGKSVGRIAN